MTEPQERLARLVEAALEERLGRRELIRRGLAMGLGLPALAGALAACGMEPPRSPASPLSPWRPTAPAPTPSLAPPAPLSGQAAPVATVAPAPTASQPAPAIEPSSTVRAPAVLSGSAPLRVAVIGDYGFVGAPAAAVAALVTSWQPELVLTLGDNNYPDGAAETIDANVGQYYSAFIAPYRGAFGPGAPENRFYPALGNHDWVVGYPQPYLDFFSPPGNGRYYQLDRGPLSMFFLDSMPGEPDGWTADSVQGRWLQEALAASTAPWRVVLMHHAPYTSGHHGPAEWMQWPFAAWGARLVLAGHDHTYERIVRDGITYVVNGLGGAARYAPGFSPAEGSQIFFNADHGALLLEATAASVRGTFTTQAGKQIDSFTLS